MLIAFTRVPSPRLPECELTYAPRRPIDLGRAIKQHAAYEAALRDLGADVRRIPPAPEQPDGVFVEDAAVVLEELAIITRPGAASRRPEVEDLAAALAPLRPLERMPAPGTLDGGDVLIDGRTVYVGASTRTNAGGRAWLRSVLGGHGYDVRVVPVTGCLHLKSAMTAPAPGVLLVNTDCVPVAALGGARIIEVDPAEAAAANALRVGERVLVAAGAPRTRRALEGLGLDVMEVELSEFALAEGGVTCCTVLVGSTE